MIPSKPTSLTDLPPLRKVVTDYQIWPEKGLGQHFLFDFNLLDRIVRTAGDVSQTSVVEIGPGPGGLTRALLQNKAKQVVVIEQDARCIDALRDIEACSEGRLNIIHGDALKLDESTLIEPSGQSYIIVANLPYNISTQLIANWLGRIERIQSMVLMVQKEVAERIIAKPHTKDYGRLSVLAQWLCHCSIAFDVNPNAFVPPPKVWSSILVLTPKREASNIQQSDLERVTKAAFSQRRKIVKAGLKQISSRVDEWLLACHIDSKLRAEDLSIDDYCRLASLWKDYQ